jgi:hypothetical protein
MKKVMSVLVVLSLLFTVCVPAFAGANVDALTDAQQKQVADLVLASVEKGYDPETIMGRTVIKNNVIAGITDYSEYKTAYDNDASSLKALVSAAVAAVKADAGFSDSAAAALTTLITGAIIDTIYPTETTTSATTQKPDDSSELSEDLQKYVDVLSKLNATQIQSVLVSLIGNKVITLDDGKAIVNELYKNKTITAEERDTILAAISSDEATTGALDKIFEGYTPADLAQLFRGFGDAISTITSALASLFKSNSNNNNNNGNNGSNGNTSNPTDIPATGDYAIPAVTAVALAAGAALILTRKKNGKDE